MLPLFQEIPLLQQPWQKRDKAPTIPRFRHLLPL
jgi:hypothetical protein